MTGVEIFFFMIMVMLVMGLGVALLVSIDGLKRVLYEIKTILVGVQGSLKNCELNVHSLQVDVHEHIKKETPEETFRQGIAAANNEITKVRTGGRTTKGENALKIIADQRKVLTQED